MTNVQFTIERPPRRWSLQTESKTETVRRSIPDSWEAVKARRRFGFWKKLLARPAAVDEILDEIIALPADALALLDAESRALLRSKLDWMPPAPDCQNVPFPSFRHRGRRLHFPQRGFENGRCLEFALAEGYFEAYMTDGEPRQLLLLTATICREAKFWKKTRLKTGDIRVELHQPDQIEARADRLKNLPVEYQMAALLFFAGAKKLVAETFPMLFSERPAADSDGDAARVEEESPQNGPKFGWWSKFMEVAAAGLFGDYEAVLQKPFWLVLMHLVDERERAKAHRREIE